MADKELIAHSIATGKYSVVPSVLFVFDEAVFGPECIGRVHVIQADGSCQCKEVQL